MGNCVATVKEAVVKIVEAFVLYLFGSDRAVGLSARRLSTDLLTFARTRC